MRFPAPLHGWRAFAGEVGTIVLGVLLALGAQELVQGLHWRSDVSETRQALDAELARDLAAFDYRYRNKACTAERLAELRRWAAALGSGKGLPLKHEIEEPPYFSIRTAAWEITDGEIASRIPVKAKLNYAALYDGMRKFDQAKNDRSLAWSKLNEYQATTRADAADLRTIKRALKDIEDVNTILEPFKGAFDRFSGQLGIKPQQKLEGADNPLMMGLEKRGLFPAALKDGAMSAFRPFGTLAAYVCFRPKADITSS